MKKIITAVMLTIAIVAISCSGGNSGSGKSGSKEKTPEQIAKLGPEAFSDDVNDIWVNALDQMDALLDKYPQINTDFEKESNEIVDGAIRKVIKYGAFLDGKSELEKTEYLLKCKQPPVKNGTDALTPFQMKLNNRFDEFKEYGNGLYDNITKLNVMLLYLKHDVLRENHPSIAEKYGVK